LVRLAAKNPGAFSVSARGFSPQTQLVRQLACASCANPEDSRLQRQANYFLPPFSLHFAMSLTCTPLLQNPEFAWSFFLASAGVATSMATAKAVSNPVNNFIVHSINVADLADLLPLPTPAEQTQHPEAGGEEWECSWERRHHRCDCQRLVGERYSFNRASSDCPKGEGRK
jgi:hypothetical protein